MDDKMLPSCQTQVSQLNLQKVYRFVKPGVKGRPLQLFQACEACRQKKVKCEGDPCSRCIKKGITCNKEPKSAKSLAKRSSFIASDRYREPESFVPRIEETPAQLERIPSLSWAPEWKENKLANEMANFVRRSASTLSWE